MPSIRLVTGLTAVAALLPTQAKAQLARPKIDTVGGHIVRVMNPGPTAWADTNGWKLVLERTIQPKDGEPGELQNPDGVRRTSTGQFVVSDREVLLFGADGRFVSTIGRRGQGPGEYKSSAIALFRDTIVIHDASLSRVTLMTTTGKLVRSFNAYSNSVGFGLDVDNGGRIRVPVFGGKGQQWNFYSITGERLDSIRLPLAAPPQEWRTGPGSMQGIPFGAYTTHRLLQDGSMLYGSTGAHRFIISRTGRDTTMVFARQSGVGVAVPEQLRDSIFRMVTAGNPDVRAIAKLSDVPRNYPLWMTLHEDGSGNIWILTRARKGPHQFDVYSRAGRFLGTVPVPFTGLQIQFLGDLVATIDTDADDLPRIRIYRIDRRGK